MNRIIKVFLLLLISLNLISCNEDYPKTVSNLNGFWSIDSRYEIKINNFNQFPDTIKDLAEKHIIKKIGKQRIQEIKYVNGYISSDKPLTDKEKKQYTTTDLLYGEDSKESKEQDSKYNYPVYSIGFEYSDIKKGIEKFDLTLMIDNKGEIIKPIDFPNLNSINQRFVSIDSIHKILFDKKISSRELKIDLRFDRKNENLYYYTRTLIRKGSILGPSCFPEYEEHFKVNAVTGELIEYNSENSIEYHN